MSDTPETPKHPEKRVAQPRLVRLRVDRPWREYPLGTKAHACIGGYWLKMAHGWKWNGPNGNGGAFPTPGGDACGACIELPETNVEVVAPATGSGSTNQGKGF